MPVIHQKNYAASRSDFADAAREKAATQDMYGAEIECFVPNTEAAAALINAMHDKNEDEFRRSILTLSQVEWPKSVRMLPSPERDSSVQSNSPARIGFEIVLPAAPFEIFCVEIGSVCGALQSLCATVTDKCGGHIHATLPLNSITAQNVCEQLCKLDHDRFSAMAGRDRTTYCGNDQGGSHYAALRFVEKVTPQRSHVEARIFSGSVSAFHWIMRAAALAAFSRNKNRPEKQVLLETSCDLVDYLDAQAALVNDRKIKTSYDRALPAQFGMKYMKMISLAVEKARRAV
jgi:hypothetical protein